MNPARLRKAPNIAIVGSSSPLGKELKDMLDDLGFPLGKLTLLETEEYAGLLQEFAGDIAITEVVSPAAFENVDIAFFACGPEILAAYAASGAPFPELTIDLTGAGRPGVVFVSGVSSPTTLVSANYLVNPHPASIALARSLGALERGFGVAASFATILEPASERGSAAVQELQEQTVSLLNFQPVEHRVFAGQLAFNVLPEGPFAARTEDLVRRQLAETFGAQINLPRVTVMQAPVFHGHALSLFVDLQTAPSVAEIVTRFAAEAGTFATYAGNAGPSPVEVIGNDKIHVGRVTADPNHPGSYGLTITIDNLRLAASNAIQTAERLMFATASQE